MNDQTPSRDLSVSMSLLAILFGTVGMGVSFVFLGSSTVRDVVAGMAGFVAGAVLVGAGTIAAAVMMAMRRAAEDGGDETPTTSSSP